MEFANYRLYRVKLRIMMHNFTQSHWRSPYEVDFVLRSQGRVLAIEVKSGMVRASHTHGLSYFIKEYPSATPIVVGGDGIPLDEFLESDVERWFPRHA